MVNEKAVVYETILSSDTHIFGNQCLNGGNQPYWGGLHIYELQYLDPVSSIRPPYNELTCALMTRKRFPLYLAQYDSDLA